MGAIVVALLGIFVLMDFVSDIRFLLMGGIRRKLGLKIQSARRILFFKILRFVRSLKLLEKLSAVRLFLN